MSTAITPMIQYTRDVNGCSVMKAQNADNVKFDGVGVISGNATLNFCSTDETYDYTQITYTTEKDSENELLLANSSGKHYNIRGEEANVKSMGGNAMRTIQVDASNSTIDLSKAAGSQAVYMTEATHDNKVILGTGSDYYEDAGKFNHCEDKGGMNDFVTKSTCHGAVIVAGAGNDTFTINGQYSVIDGGNGTNTFNMMGIFGEQENVSYRNIVLGGNGNDSYNDKGGYNIFFGAGGSDTVNLYGTKSIADVSDNNAEVTGGYASSSIESLIFVDEDKTYDGKTYNIYDIMNKYDWTLNEFLNIYSKVSINNPDSLASKNVIDGKTMAKLNAYFANNLQANNK